jgi:septal ring factor EnvC (AmiA/AmiB activator)
LRDLTLRLAMQLHIVKLEEFQSMIKRDKALLKLAEELSELTTRILQQLNKTKDYNKKIEQEISDVEKQIATLKKLLN